MDVSDSHPLNDSVPIEDREDGIVIDVRFLQPRNARCPIVVRFDVMFTVLKLEHTRNEYVPTSVRPDRTVIDDNNIHPSNAL